MKQFALSGYAELLMVCQDHASPARYAHRFSQACANKSRSTIN